jgi:group I intron endonuclease
MIIYKAVNKVNGKIYIGQTRSTVDQRIYEHLKIGGSPVFHKALKKYGIKSFELSIIDFADSIQELNQKEVYWIKFYNSKIPNGYNLTDGGNGPIGYVWTEVQRRNHRRDLKGKTYEEIFGEEKAKILKRKISEAIKGKTWEEIFGEEKSKELKKILSDMSKKRKGKTYEELYGEELAKQLKIKRKGKTYEEMYGKEKAKEAKRKIGEGIKRKTRKGKTYEEIFGEEKAKQLKREKSDAIKGRHWNCKKIRKIDIRKGKTWEEIYGKEKAKEMRENLSRNRKGRKRGSYISREQRR